MSDKQLYEVLTRSKSGNVYRYVLWAEVIEYWAEPESQERLTQIFRDGSAIEEEVLEIRASDFLYVVNQVTSEKANTKEV